MAELLWIALVAFLLAVVLDFISNSIKVDDVPNPLFKMSEQNSEKKAWLYTEVMMLEDGIAEKWGSLHNRLLEVRDTVDFNCFYIVMKDKMITVYDRYDNYIRIEVSEVKL